VRPLLSLLPALLVTLAPTAQAGPITGSVRLASADDAGQVVVYVEGVRGASAPAKEQPQINHVDLRFTPRTLAVLKGTTVAFPSSDSVLHSAFSVSKSNPFELGVYGKGATETVTFANPGLVEVFCHLHSDMRAYVLVLENPFFATPAKDGTFSIAGVPDGAYQVKAWVSPSRNESKSVTVRGAAPVTLSFALPGR
jgi:plastocyanin